MKKLKISFLLLLVIVLAVTACSSNQGVSSSDHVDQRTSSGDPNQNGGDESESEAPLKLSVMLSLVGEVPNADEVIKRVEEYTNTELDVRWTPSLNDVLPVSMAAGDVPDIITFGNSQLRQNYMVNAMRGGVLWDLTPYIDDYPNLKATNSIFYENTSLDGRIYGLPRVRELVRRAFIYRKDWADELNIKEPQTIEEFTEMLRAFKEHKQVYGMVFHSETDFKEWGTLFGAPNEWAIADDGSFISAYTTDEYLEGIKYIKSLYDEGLINPDFPITQRAQWFELFNEGKAGILPDVVQQGINEQNKMPDAVLDMFAKLEGPHGIRLTSANGTNGIVAFTKTGSLKTEDDLRRALKFYDQLAEEEMSTLFWWGIEGVHYELEDGLAVRTDAERYANEISRLRNELLSVPSNENAIKGKLHPLEEKADHFRKELPNYSINNPALALISETQAERGGQLENIMNDADVRFIIGEIDENGWKEAVERWRREGGDKIAEELAEEYRKIN